jgi:putative Ca2+/H+ antiporter (TMEM165/GDT1 family)
MLALFLTAYGMVFLTELVGDKTLLTIGALSTRSRPLPLLSGISVAFMAKTLVAVLLGGAIARLPLGIVTAMSVATFVAIALVIWFKKPAPPQTERVLARHWSKTALMAFGAIFFSEWGDLGQITAATLAAQSQQVEIVWLGATLALITKGSLVVAFGVGLRRWLPQRALRCGAFVLCLVMGLLTAFRIPL